MQTIKQIKVTLGGDLGQTTKMPGKSFGLSTWACPTGSKLQGVCGSVCEGCYAKRLEAFRPSVQKGHDTRTAAVLTATESAIWMRDWIVSMTELIGHRYKGVTGKDRVFRWHDSGDVQNYKHLRMIVAVAVGLPDIQFWLPTKEKKLVSKYLRECGDFPDNLTVRVSSAMVDAKPLNFPLTSTVHKDAQPIGHVCPAPQQDGECGSCRACWDKKVPNVSYHKH